MTSAGVQTGSAEAKVPLTIELTSVVTCPICRHQAVESMPVNACLVFYECKGCGTLLKPKQDECCVFCSYGSAPCPPIQAERAAGSAASCCGAGRGADGT